MWCHEHMWEPIYAEVGRYNCACGASGYRQRDGTILESLVWIGDPDELITARPTHDCSINEHGRRVAMVPTD